MMRGRIKPGLPTLLGEESFALCRLAFTYPNLQHSVFNLQRRPHQKSL